MKKNLFFHFSVLAMLIVLISACSSKKPEYTNVIPSDASQVIAVNLKSLADKAGTKDKETKEALQKLTDALKSDMNAATFQQLEAVLKDPAKSGVDVNAPIYVFNAPSFPYTTMVAKVQSEDDLLKLLEVTDNQPCGRSGRLQFCTNQQAGIARFHSYHAYGGELHRHIATGKSQRRNSRLAETDRRKQHQQ